MTLIRICDKRFILHYTERTLSKPKVEIELSHSKFSKQYSIITLWKDTLLMSIYPCQSLPFIFFWVFRDFHLANGSLDWAPRFKDRVMKRFTRNTENVYYICFILTILLTVMRFKILAPVKIRQTKLFKCSCGNKV